MQASMLRQFCKDSVIYGISSMISGGLSILLLPFLTRSITTEEYGIIDLYTAMYAIAAILVPLSITQATARYYPSIESSERYRYTSTGFWFTSIAFFAAFISAWIFIVPLNRIITGDDQYVGLTFLAVSAMAIHGVFNYLQVHLRWILQPMVYAISNVIFVLISLAATVVLIKFFNNKASGYWYARILATVLAGLFIWPYIKNDIRLYFDYSALLKMLNYSIPLVFSSMGILVCLYIDRLLIRTMMTLNDVGIYSASAKIASVASVVMTVINFALTPLIYTNHADPKTPKQVAYLFKLIIYMMLIAIVVLLIAGKKILVSVAGEAYAAGYWVLPLMTASYVVSGLYNLAPGLWIANKTKLIASINIISAILNIILCLVLIPLFGYTGAALATLLSSIIAIIVTTNFAQRYYYISYDWMRISRAVMATIFLGYLIAYF